MLKFIDENDFALVDTYSENTDGSVSWIYDEGEGLPTHSGIIREGFTRTTQVQTGTTSAVVGQDENGEDITEEQPIFEDVTIGVWTKLQELASNGTITIQPVPQSELDAIAAEQAKQAQDALKRTGTEINGHTISLTEENQNGLAAVMQGAQLADEARASIFPLNFNARTATGEVSIPFANKSDYEAFCLAFLQARQQFF